MFKRKTEKFKMTRQEKSWVMYDWANSVYATVMMAAVFPIYFTNVAESAGQQGDYWWGIATSAAMIVIALLAPIAGAFCDFHGYKKKIFILFFALGVGFTFASAFFDNWIFLLFGYGISHIGFSGSILVNDAFLSDVTEPERMDTLSGYGFAYGYIGGSTIPFLMSIALINFGGNFGIDMTMAVRISVVIAALWWGLFTIPFLKNCKQTHSIEMPSAGKVVKSAFIAVGQTAKKIFHNKKILIFILAYFFYIDGVGTVINMSTSYGTTLGLDATGMILALLVTQIVAVPCSIWFSALSRRFGSIKMLRAAVCVYLVICITGFIMGFGLEEGFFGVETALVLFWILATMVGSVQGGIQAISRSYFCQMVPPENAGEFFGFFDIFGKFAAVLGPLLYAMTVRFTGRSSLAILSIIALFATALIIMGAGNKYLKADDKKAV
ncbi:MAG: MFS transporter [Lachnospiraceae bacterium]|nr:MFS transporter [Lachnospiraceae bacterium]